MRLRLRNTSDQSSTKVVNYGRSKRPSRNSLHLIVWALALASALCLVCLVLLSASVGLEQNSQVFPGESQSGKAGLVLSEFKPLKQGSNMLSIAKESIVDDKLLDESRRVQRYLLRTTNRSSLPLTAYVEPPLPGLSNETELPLLPLRLHGPEALRMYVYNQVNTCSDLATNLPVDHSLELQSKFGSNAGHTMKSLYPLRYEYAQHACPVDADPFLPWIHDVFPNAEATHIEFVAHNKRKCRSGAKDFIQDLDNLEPQVTLMQSVPIKRVTEAEVREIAPQNLWSNTPLRMQSFRYRLASLQEADEDARETRFICQFHRLAPIAEGGDTVGTEKVVLGETLSVFPYNYEHANYRKPRSHPMLTRPRNADDRRGAHNEQIWNTILHIRCPVPHKLRSIIWGGHSVVQDMPTIYLDFVPIRTRPRMTREGYFPQAIEVSSFDPQKEWGNKHVLPIIESSGRWANIPVCLPPTLAKRDFPERANIEQNVGLVDGRHESQAKQHTLVGCLWASSAFAARGNSEPTDSSTLDRLLEWLTFHLYIAKLDHVYVYDNSGAFSNQTSLATVVGLFPADRVTRVLWSHRVCNNNGPSHPNVGERSSQYAAEASCRLRYGPQTEWMVFFDTDEYLIPQGKWSDLKEWLTESVKSRDIHENTNILSFFQSRALPNVDFMEPHYGGSDEAKCGKTLSESKCVSKSPDSTFLEAYDCESTPLPKPDWGWRAKKQIFRPDFVLNHHVHYSTVTRRLISSPEQVSPPFVERRPYERRVDELNEAFMLHAKTTNPLATHDWQYKCHHEFNKSSVSCPVGIPWPTTDSGLKQNLTYREDGMGYNCHTHERVRRLSSMLKELLNPLLERYRQLS